MVKCTQVLLLVGSLGLLFKKKRRFFLFWYCWSFKTLTIRIISVVHMIVISWTGSTDSLKISNSNILFVLFSLMIQGTTADIKIFNVYLFHFLVCSSQSHYWMSSEDIWVIRTNSIYDVFTPLFWSLTVLIYFTLENKGSLLDPVVPWRTCNFSIAQKFLQGENSR